jgi:hypothetical protein
MSSHPNAILLLVLKPDDLARKTHRAIMAEAHAEPDAGNIKIGSNSYYVKVMESNYDDDFQITADEGDIIVLDMVTYGYGERVEWDKLEAQKRTLSDWATGICERHKCSPKIYMTANHW